MACDADGDGKDNDFTVLLLSIGSAAAIMGNGMLTGPV
jgi:hypothetical protein|tara:strand:+ start:1332 stop:1445 length:114 start_codon:yes stop_codon:yes gene_type:complete